MERAPRGPSAALAPAMFPTLILALALVLALGACSSPYGPGGLTGDGTDDSAGGERATVVVTLGSSRSGGLTGATILPELDLTSIDLYRVTLSEGPAGAAVPEPVELPGDPQGLPEGQLLVRHVVPGTWTVMVEALREGPSGEQVLLRGTSAPVTVTAGGIVEVEVALRPVRDGHGAISFVVEWPDEFEMAAVEYRMESNGVPSDWTTIPASEFDHGAGLYSALISVPHVEAGDHIFSIRLDAGPLRWNRYRALAEEVVHVYDEITTEATFSLTAQAFALREPEPGSWEELEEEGVIVINPDGSITFTDTGYDYAAGGGDITVDPDDYSITFSGSGERRIYMNMPAVSSARLEVYDAHMTQGNGWGLFFHGTEQGGSTNFSGYTLQFDPGLGNRIVIRQWVAGNERTPFISIDADVAGIDLYQPKNAYLEVDGPALRVQVEQPPGGAPITIIDEPDITAMAGVTGNARTDGYMGVRNWDTTDLTIGEIKLFVYD